MLELPAAPGEAEGGLLEAAIAGHEVGGVRNTNFTFVEAGKVVSLPSLRVGTNLVGPAGEVASKRIQAIGGS
jgi:hypothetical protein